MTVELEPLMPTFMEGSRLHLGSVIALLVVIAAAILLRNTLKGFEIRLPLSR